MNSYELSRNWFDWCFENTDIINPNHTAMYFFIIEHNNRLGWKEKFGLPTEMTKDALGISNYRTFAKTFNDLIDWGFVKLYTKSKNQYSSNVIGLVKNAKAHTKALDKAMQKQVIKQVESIVGIDKPINIITEEQINAENGFDSFWLLYPKKVAKDKCRNLYNKLAETDKQKISDTLEAFISYKQFDTYTHPNPYTYLNQKRFNDPIPNLEQKHTVIGKTNQLTQTYDD